MLRSLHIPFAVSALCFLPNAPFAAGQAKEPTGRPGIAVKIEVDGKEAKLTIALSYLQDAKAKPTFEGVRFYTYSVTLDEAPRPIGWKADKEKQSVILHGTKYTYIKGEIDRQENGSIRITTQTKNTFRIVGIYHYMDQLFVIDGVLMSGEPLLLFEAGGAK